MTILVVILAMIVVVPIQGSEAVTKPDDYPTEPVILYFYSAGSWTVLYRLPGEIGGGIPEPPPGCTCWARSDTKEVITPETIFDAGSYLIEAYGTPPEPWDPPETPSDEPDNTLPIIAIVLSSAAIITSGVAIVMMIRRK